MKLVAIRGVLIRGLHYAPGETFEVDKAEAAIVIGTGRAMVAPVEVPQLVEPVESETTDAPKRGRPRKDQK